MELTVRRFTLATRHPFTIARGTVTEASLLLVELEQDGVRGFGEVTEALHYDASLEASQTAIEQVRALTEQWRLDDPAVFSDALREAIPAATFARSALDLAAHDLWGKLRGQPVWQLWGLQIDHLPPSDYTIGIDTPQVMQRKLEEFPGFPVYKIKLGTPEDLAIVRALRTRTSAIFRVDANEGWTVEQTLAHAEPLAALGVELIEQPLPAADRRGMERVAAASPLPIFADESCRDETDIDRVAETFQGINVKLGKCGGLAPARRMIARARQLGLKVMVGCFTESTVGISAAAQLVPLVDHVDLDGALLLAEDIAQGVRIDRGQVIFPERAGCGVETYR